MQFTQAIKMRSHGPCGLALFGVVVIPNGGTARGVLSNRGST